jgi:S1-C subfamily serine protease
MRGVQVDELTPQIRDQLGLNSGVKGVVVSEVADGSSASDAGLLRGDVIEQVNRESVNSVADYDRLVGRGGKQAVVLLVNRGGATTFIVVEPE